jgi:hypothetical protein
MNEEEHGRSEDRGPDSPALFGTDTFYSALAADSRRRVLAHLLERQETTVDELVDVLCGWEVDTGEMLGPETRDRIEIALRHNHLPQLVDAELVTVDWAAETVEIAALPVPVRNLIRRSVDAGGT